MGNSEEIKPFEYGKSPDGEKMYEKLMFIYKPIAYTAFAFGTIDVMLYSKPKTYLGTLGRYAHCSWPLFAAATTFVCVSNGLGQIRQKNDRLNWFAAGLSSGAIYGIWRQKTMAGISIGMACGLLALAVKHSYLRGYTLLPDKARPQYGTVWSVNHDWTLYKHRPGNWSTKE